MPEQPIKDKTAIVGLGWTTFSRDSGRTVLDLTAEATVKAADDAGLSPKDLDGIVTYFHERDTITPHELTHALELPRVNYSLFNNMGGGWSSAAVLTAAMLVHAGVCRNVLVYRSANGRSARGVRGGTRQAAGESQYLLPYGILHAAATFGYRATAHMARFGTTTIDMAHLAVTQRKHAMLNTKAQMRQPISIEDHQNSRWIVYPYRLLDCCLQTDGAVALIVTSAERARDLKHTPVHIMSGVGGEAATSGSWETNAANAAPLLYEGAGVTAKDVDVAEIYDPFTLQAMIHMEDYGFVPKGEAGGWVREGKNGLDGETPINTHGGLLSEAYFQGLNHVIEAVQQLRPEGVVDDLCNGPHTYDRTKCRQVRDAQIALTCGEDGGSSLLLRRG
ncbi:MAG TPA: lipid carrier protein IgrF [Chloroflexota bacterium]|nr:lipid carrier protein IgrF [Chloroflexota bacterium]